MGTLYARGTRLWIGYVDLSGKRRYVSTGLGVGDEAKARKLLEKVEAKVTRERVDGAQPEGPMTVRRFADAWIAGRRREGLWSVDDDASRLKLHALPRLGELVLREVRPRHLQELFQVLRAKVGGSKEQLAPRTVRHVYGALHAMFEAAVAEELIDTNPCVLKKSQLPKKSDKDPAWRAGAVFTREEVQLLLSSPVVPADRRAVYALMFVGGLRFGEVAALRWRHLLADVAPLGKLVIASSYSTKKRVEKGVKTDRPREMPVHPVLAELLTHWRTKGWSLLVGREPGADDLIVPSREGVNRNSNHGLARLHEDLERLGLRPRRQHDARRTFITLARADGARGEVLEWCTHTPKGDIIDQYTSLPWGTFCEEVAKLRLTLPPLPEGLGGPRPGRRRKGELLHPLLQSPNPSERLQDSSGEGGIRTRGTLSGLTAFPVRRLRPLGHLSRSASGHSTAPNGFSQRRARDSNPWYRSRYT
jgi:integrase